MTTPKDPPFTPAAHPDIGEDLRTLGTQEELGEEERRRLQRIALYRIENLLNREERGPALDPNRGDGLHGLRKLYFDTQPELRRWRIVYRELEGNVLELVAIGPRKDMEVYRTAAVRLGRAEQEEHPVAEQIDPIRQESDRLLKEAAAERKTARRLESEAESREAAVERDKGPTVSAIRALGGASPKALAQARETDLEAITGLRQQATQHREAATRLRAAARALQESNPTEAAPDPQQQEREAAQHEPYSPPDGPAPPPGTSRSL